MLKSLHIENMAVIKRLDLEPCGGFSVITGETGAGKSVIIDSINFLICSKVPRDLLRTGEEKAMVSGSFSDLSETVMKRLEDIGISAENGEVCIERTLSSDGRTVCRIDGRVVSQAVLKSAGQCLLSIHGQNDTRQMNDSQSRISIIDSLAHDGDLLDEYRELFSKWSQIRNEMSGLRKSENEKNQLRDMLEYQIKDITAHNLKPGEDEQLEAEKKRLQSLGKIRKMSDTALKAVYQNEKGITASYLVDRAADALSKISDVVPEYKSLSERLKSCRYELDDIAYELKNSSGAFDSGNTEADLDKIENRLEIIDRLKRKYGSDVNQIIKFAENAQKRLDEIDLADELLEKLAGEETAVFAEMSEKAAQLSEKRRSAGAAVESDITSALRYLDMPKVRFEVSVKPSGGMKADGADDIDFMFAANAGEPMKPLSEAASGGELSRVMLAIKCAIAGADGIPTLIFDEIDTGISGRTSRKVGFKLREVSRTSQVICVTHSAQVASLAETHLFISKHENEGRTETSVRVLDLDGRIEENARIIGGINVTEAQRQAAIDMIKENTILE